MGKDMGKHGDTGRFWVCSEFGLVLVKQAVCLLAARLRLHNAPQAFLPCALCCRSLPAVYDEGNLFDFIQQQPQQPWDHALPGQHRQQGPQHAQRAAPAAAQQAARQQLVELLRIFLQARTRLPLLLLPPLLPPLLLLPLQPP